MTSGRSFAGVHFLGLQAHIIVLGTGLEPVMAFALFAVKGRRPNQLDEPSNY